MSSRGKIPDQEITNCNSLVPDQKTGWKITAQATFHGKNDTEARDFFEIVLGRLKNVNDWNTLLKGKLGHFQLTDALGAAIRQPVQKGQFIRIDVTGPGPKSGGGFDWVRVEDIESCCHRQVSYLAIRVRPSKMPSGRTGIVSHFYAPVSTSTFIVERSGLMVTAAIYDRNISVNTAGASFWEKLRNVFAGFLGKVAVSKIQWQDLANGLIAR